MSSEKTLKILVVSNFFPPHFLGGYELGCFDVVTRLKERGHKIDILTSSYGLPGPEVHGSVHRLLNVFPEFSPTIKSCIKLLRNEAANQRALRRLIASTKPDVIYLWNLQFGCASLSDVAAESGVPIITFVSDHWPNSPGKCDWATQLSNPSKFPGVAKRWSWLFKSGLTALSSTRPTNVLRTDVAQYCSDFMKRSCQSATQANRHEVIHWGVDADRYKLSEASGGRTKFLYAGQLISAKGIQTGVEAFLRVCETNPDCKATLTIAGGALDPSLELDLTERVETSTAKQSVEFVGKKSRDEIRDLYKTHNAFLFPSEWNEPFSIALVEAMASGLTIVGTQTGGTPEILIDGQTGVTFHAGDVQSCANAIRRVLTDSNLVDRIRKNATECARSHFNIKQMVDRIESSLLDMVNGVREPVPSPREATTSSNMVEPTRHSSAANRTR